MAAVLAGGPEAVLSHHAAAALWDLRPNPQGRIDVTAPGKRDHKGVRCHISPLPATYRTTIDAIPVTTVYRTYIDYAEIANQRQIRAALEEGQRRGILDFRKLHQAIDDHPGRRGLKPLRAAMQDLADDPPWLASDLEREFAELLRAARLPAPSHNVIVEGELVDCAWPAQRVIVELDGYGFHRGRHAFEADRRRDMKLQAAGWRVIRITYRRIRDDAPALMEEIRKLLAG
jgi:very-short-patch-repair endonuclease